MKKPNAFDNLSEDDDIYRRQLSIALENGGCQVTRAHMAPIDIPPTWQASFPGSGSRMTWSLVEAMTGIRTTDDYDTHDRGYERVVAVKTHYPVKDAFNSWQELDERYFQRAMVIFRNPMNAVPSYFNLQYEHIHNLPNHSTRGPNKYWLEYRNNPDFGLDVQLKGYEAFATYWMDKYDDRSNLLLLSYEDLTSQDLGSSTAQRIADYLGETEGVEPIDSKSIPCIWETVVNYKNHPPPATQQEEVDTEVEVKNRKLRVSFAERYDPASERSGPRVRPYTADNLQAMIDMFNRLMIKYSHNEEFVSIMESYIEKAESTEPIDDSDVE